MAEERIRVITVSPPAATSCLLFNQRTMPEQIAEIAREYFEKRTL